MTSRDTTTTRETAARPAVTHVAGAQALARAAAAGDRAGVEALLAAGAFADAPLPNGETPLMRAALRGFEDVARLLLESGANASARRADGFTPLTLAAFFGHVGVARLLIERGADVSARTRLGTTARAWADARGFSEISALIADASDSRRSVQTAEQRVPRQPSEAERAADERAESVARPGPTLQPVAGVLLAALAPEAQAAKGGEERARASESELRARASQVSEVFGATSAGASAVESADFDERSRSARDVEPGASRANAELEPSGDRSGGELFASVRAARPARAAWAARSWQGAAGLLLLALACSVAVYAAWRSTRPGPKPGQGVAPQAAGAQPVAPLPAAQPSTPQPSPGMTPLDPQSLAGPGANVPGAFVPYPAGPPAALPPATAYPGGASTSAPGLVYEEGRGASPEARREGGDAARERGGAGATAGDESSRETRSREGDSRANAPQQVGAPPVVVVPVPRPAPTAAEPPPSPTPGRKVIQWPPS